MKSNKTVFAMFLVAMVALLSVSTSFAQDAKKDDAMKKDAMMKEEAMKKDAMMKEDGMKKDGMMKDDGMMAMKDDRPVVAVIKASWCPACKTVEPLVAELKTAYGEKMNFVSFDVTDEAAIAESKVRAEKLGLGKFFDEHKEKTATFAIFKDNKVVYNTRKNYKKADYEKELDKVLK